MQNAPYNEAEALILSFIVNNYPKGDNRTVLTKAFEKKFLEIMQNWNSEYFDYAYFSEVKNWCMLLNFEIYLNGKKIK